MSKLFETVTFTTYGYKDFTENLIESAKVNNLQLNLNLYVLDNESNIYFKNKVDKITIIESENNFVDFMDQKNSQFGNLMYKKFECIFKSLNEYEFVLYTDSDITIKKDINRYLLNKIVRKDILLQNDKNPKKPNQINACAGFMFIRSNKKTLKFFNPDNLPIEKIINYRTHDQTYINKNLAKFNYALLPMAHFPNGPYFYQNYEKLDPAMVHFNYILGKEKIDYMKKYGEWYLK